MKKLNNKLNNVFRIFSLLIFLTISASAQTPAPSPASTPEKSVQTVAAPKVISLSEIPAGEKFTSIEGRFTIAMPRDGGDFDPIVPDADMPKEKGGRHTWIFKEGLITIEYSDNPDMVVKTEKDYTDIAEGLRAGIDVFGGTVTSEKAIKLGEHRGYEITFIDPAKLKGITRMIIVGETRYTLFFLSMPGGTPAPELAVKVLDTFEVIAAPIKKSVVSSQ